MRNFELFISKFVEYGDEYKSALVPARYVCSDGYPLGKKITSIRKGDIRLNDYERKILDENGFTWSVHVCLKFEEKLTLIEKFKKEHGHCRVRKDYVSLEGVKLGYIVDNMIYGKVKLSEEQRQMLIDIGFNFGIRKKVPFEVAYAKIVEYKDMYGDCLVPQKHVTKDGIALGIIVSTFRARKHCLSEAHIKLLDDIEFVWKVRTKRTFEEVCEMLLQYKEKYGNLLVSQKHKTDDGTNLGYIVANIRSGRIKLTQEQKDILTNMGFVWRVRKKDK